MMTTTAIAQVLALEDGIAFDVTNPVLVHMAQELPKRLKALEIDLLALRMEGDTLVARIDESFAEEPLCPGAFRRVVRDLGYKLTGRVLDARIEDATPDPAAPVDALAVA